VQANQHETAAADVPAAWVDHGQRVRDGNRGIYGITAGAQDAYAGLGSVVVCGRDHRVTRRRAGQERREKGAEKPYPVRMCVM
jgi:hypothetical protein